MNIITRQLFRPVMSLARAIRNELDKDNRKAGASNLAELKRLIADEDFQLIPPGSRNGIDLGKPPEKEK